MKYFTAIKEVESLVKDDRDIAGTTTSQGNLIVGPQHDSEIYRHQEMKYLVTLLSKLQFIVVSLKT